MSQYSAAVPSDGQVRPEIKEFFERFYAVSDTSDGHEKYADMFTKDAKLIMASNGVTGREGESTPTHVPSSQDINKRQTSSRCATVCGRRSPSALTSLSNSTLLV